MKKAQDIQRLIEADDLRDYPYFVELEFAQGSFLTELQNALKDPSKEKYIQATKAFFEMQIVHGILEKNESPLEKGLDLVQEARAKRKPHVSVALLQPEKRFEIEIQMPYHDVETLAGEFINSISCPNFVIGRCRTACIYNMIWTPKVNCYSAHRTAYELLRKYSGNNHKIAINSMIKIREKQ